ncbi:MAG TPA: hypothetical protein VKA67_00810 [Verrucomicrobiae bacterium]|nr:hypothetical protein [Verrucomicrobiae bacterium]
MNSWDLIPILLLMLFSIALGGGTAIVLLVLHWRRREFDLRSISTDHNEGYFSGLIPLRAPFLRRPTVWLAIRNHNLVAVQSALALHNAKPTSLVDGRVSSQELLIAPPFRGWILVFGSGLPNPADDVDVCFRFLLDLSRKLGHVQFFVADQVLCHHAWAQAEAGRVIRAYAWAGQTLWNQGIKTVAELKLGFKCFNYGELSEGAVWNRNEVMAANADKVPLLAAHWSLDPAEVQFRLAEQGGGITGEMRRIY